MASFNSAPKSARKRFVSGARCPQCGAEDKVYLLGEGLDARRLCNQCDFEERLGDVVEPNSTDPDVDQSDVEEQASVSVVRIKMPE